MRSVRMQSLKMRSPTSCRMNNEGCEAIAVQCTHAAGGRGRGYGENEERDGSGAFGRRCSGTRSLLTVISRNLSATY